MPVPDVYKRQVYEFSRRNIPMEGVTHLSVDVTDEDAVNAAVQQVIQKETKIDAVINGAGFGISGAVEFTSCLLYTSMCIRDSF